MLEKKEIVQITRDAVSELMGMGYDGSTQDDLAALSLSDLVEFGKTASNNGTTITNELWYKTLIGKCARFFVESRRLTLHIPQIFKTSYEWGGFVEFVTFNLATVYDSLIYSQAALSDPNSKFYGKTIAEIEHDLYKVEYESKIYDEFKDFMVPYTKPNESINSGLRDENDFMVFMAGLAAAVENTLTQIINTYAHALVSVAAAYSISPAGATAGVTGATVDGSNTAVHLVTEYKAYTGDNTWTAGKMLQDKTAYAWIENRIENVRSFMTENTAVYNNHTKSMFGQNIHGVMLAEIYNGYESVVAANSYNPVSLGDWQKISGWQAVKDNAGTFTFAVNSSIAIKADGTKGIYNVSNGAIADFNQENVIALLYDEKAIGMTVEDTVTTSQYTAVTNTVNVFTNKRLNYIINTDYPMVAFVLN